MLRDCGWIHARAPFSRRFGMVDVGSRFGIFRDSNSYNYRYLLAHERTGTEAPGSRRGTVQEENYARDSRTGREKARGYSWRF